MEEKHRCEERLFSDYKVHQCHNNASAERDGKWYCKIHDPVIKKAKSNKRFEKWEQEWAEAKQMSRRRQAMNLACEGVSTEVLETIKVKDLLKEG